MSLREGGRPVLAMVESNTTGTGRKFAVAARARGLRPVLLTTRPERYPWVEEDDVDVAWADTTDPACVADVARAVASGPGAEGAHLAGVVTSSEYFVAVAARAAVRLGLPGADPGAVERCRDKRRQRAALVASGVAVPAHSPATTPEDAVAAASAIGFPVVVKPADGTGSRGVRLCCNAAEVRDHTAALLARRHDERGRPTTGAVLVEEYVDGPEFSVETFGVEVIGITAKHLGPAPWFVEYGHDFPADPSFEVVDPLLTATGCGEGPYRALSATGCAQAGLAAAEALGLGFGPAHTEIRLGPRGPVVIEVNPRLAGGRIPILVRLATGLDLVDATVGVAIGEAASLPQARLGHASIRFLVARQPGRVRRTGGVLAASAVPGIVDVAIAARPGQRIGGTGSFLDRVGHVIATGPTDSAARSAAEEALSRLELDIDNESATEPLREPAFDLRRIPVSQRQNEAVG
ncbi:MAG TPA: ATP-grasp domain-containing protein [Acidimicrobiia bacterium]|nr:ATP-grasp domain-containing protein [Acidimicrobiia bacterium]